MWKLGQWTCLTFVPLALIIGLSCSNVDDAGPTQANVLCGPGGENACGDKKCDPVRGCVECMADADCTAGTPDKRFCIAGECQGCRSNSDCTAPAGSCWPSDHQCRGSCAAGTKCPLLTPLCDNPSGACVRCTDSSQCLPPSPICDDATRECVQCKGDHDCPEGAPRCVLRTGQCAGCLYNSDCPASKPICDPVSLACRAGCTSDSQCSKPNVHCNIAGRCAECLTDKDCPVSENNRKQVCKVEGECVECRSKADCPADAPNCSDGVCTK